MQTLYNGSMLFHVHYVLNLPCKQGESTNRQNLPTVEVFGHFSEEQLAVDSDGSSKKTKTLLLDLIFSDSNNNVLQHKEVQYEMWNT